MSPVITMDNLATIMEAWEGVLNSDAELAERGKSIYSTLEGKSAVQIEIEGFPAYHVDVADGRFTLSRGAATGALIAWKLPLSLFKDIMLGKHRLIYTLLDPRGTLTFDAPNFTHWNGATIIEMLYLACEMAQKNRALARFGTSGARHLYRALHIAAFACLVTLSVTGQMPWWVALGGAVILLGGFKASAGIGDAVGGRATLKKSIEMTFGLQAAGSVLLIVGAIFAG